MSAKKKMVTTTTRADTVERFLHNHRYPTRWKLGRNNLYLSTEVIFNILIYVPAEVLFKVMRYVCKQWYDIVSDPLFVTAHSRMSTPGLLIQHSDQIQNAIYIEPHMATMNETPVGIPFVAPIMCCFNGLLVLLSNSRNPKGEIIGVVFHVVNPVTKVLISLPHLANLRYVREGISLAVDSSGHYKVVYVSGKKDTFEHVQMRVFTLGVDKAWRSINVQDIPVVANRLDLMLFHSFCFGGFIYWFTYYTSPDISPFGFALDVDTEIIYPLSMPKGVIMTTRCPILISMETGPGLVTKQDDLWRVWEMTDVKSSEWTELTCINMRAVYAQIDNEFGAGYFTDICPFRLFKGDLWLSCHHTIDDYVVVRYDIARESFNYFPIKRLFNHNIHLHASTLVSPKNC